VNMKKRLAGSLNWLWRKYLKKWNKVC